MTKFKFSIKSFAACSPPIDCISGFQRSNSIKWDETICIKTWLPDVSFIPKQKFRRLSRISKMALYSAHHASLEAPDIKIGPPIFCSRYSEFHHTTSIWNNLVSGNPVSPMNFSYSVHNTGQGLFSILHQDTRSATALSARNGVVEQALIKAYAQLQGGDDGVLIVYHEDTLPQAFDKLLNQNVLPLSFAIVVGKHNNFCKRSLTLSYKSENNPNHNKNLYHNLHEQNIVRILASGVGKKQLKLNRLTWDWEFKIV